MAAHTMSQLPGILPRHRCPAALCLAEWAQRVAEKFQRVGEGILCVAEGDVARDVRVVGHLAVVTTQPEVIDSTMLQHCYSSAGVGVKQLLQECV